MKLISLTAICLLFTFLSLAEVGNSSLLTRQTEEKINCPSVVCFGIENSKGLTTAQFNLQKEFALALIGRLTRRTTKSSFTLVSYGTSTETLLPLSSDYSEAYNALSDLAYSADEKVFLGGPIVSCDAKLRDEPENAKIILFSSGLDNLGGDPEPRAEVFRQRSGGDIFIVSIGNKNTEELKSLSKRQNSFYGLTENWTWEEVAAIATFLCF